MSWLGAIGDIFRWVSGSSIAAALTRVVVGVGLMRYLNKTTENADKTDSATTPQGVRQQIPPATDNKIPIVYGDAYLGGTIVDVQLSNSNKELYAVLVLCEETGDVFSTNPSLPGSRTASSITIDNIYLNNQQITFNNDGTTINYTTDDTGVQDTNAKNLVGIYLYTGGSDAPMLPCQPGTVIPISGTVPPVAYEVMPGWGVSHTCQNTIFAIVKMNYDPSKGLRSIPNLKFHVRNTLNKPGDVLHDYMTNQMYGGGVDESTIDPYQISDLNSYSDETVTYPGHAAQKRYVINGVIRTTESVMSNMQRIAGAAGAYIGYDITIGKWGVVVNRPQEKSLEFNDSNIIGQIGITGTALENYYNSVEVQFPYAYLRDQMNFTRIDLPQIMRNDNEPDNQLQITHELVNNLVQAAVLGNMELRQSREDISVTFTTDYSKFNVQVGDVVGITNSVYGWTSKQFRVIRVKRNDSEEGRLTLEITALAYNPDVYTVEDISNFTPTIGTGYSIPNLGAISKPDRPIINTGATISSQPSIVIDAIVPNGIVTEMEYWYTSDDTQPDDNLRNYILLGSTRAENSGPFTTGDHTSFKTVLLNTDNYYFKVRAANQYGTSQFSDPSVLVPYTYIQAPNVLPVTVPVIDPSGTPVVNGDVGLNLGMLGAYVASQLNWFGEGGIFSGNASLESIFGLTGDEATTISNAVASNPSNVSVSNSATYSLGLTSNIIAITSNVEVIDSNGNVTTSNTTVGSYQLLNSTFNQDVSADASNNVGLIITNDAKGHWLIDSEFILTANTGAIAAGFNVVNLGKGHWEIQFSGTINNPTPPTNPAYGTLLSQYCSGTTLMGRYANGSGGSYDAVIQTNSVTCGYTTTYPVSGTLLSQYCSGTTLMGRYANGSGGSYTGTIALNSTSCGYVAPVSSRRVVSFDVEWYLQASPNTPARTISHYCSKALSTPVDGSIDGSSPTGVITITAPSSGVLNISQSISTTAGNFDPSLRVTGSFNLRRITFSDGKTYQSTGGLLVSNSWADGTGTGSGYKSATTSINITALNTTKDGYAWPSNWISHTYTRWPGDPNA